MTPFNAILVATDFSIDGNNAVRRAALLAHQHGAGLHILHVLKEPACRPLREWFTPLADIEQAFQFPLFERHSDRWIKSSKINANERDEWFARIKAWTGLATLR